jgi:poly(A) polymerase
MTQPDRETALPSFAGETWLQRAPTQAVFAALAAAGHEARAVGGAVRNALMGLPVVEVDIATPATPEEVIRACSAAGLRCVPTGVEHGTVTVISDHTPFEVTTLREDVETFGRHATVSFTVEWAADARRRDFTMNALYCTADGRVEDPLGGYADVQQRRVRFIGDAAERIREDYLRILRFFRFHAAYGRGAPDPAGLAACVRERAGLAQLSAERVRAELVRLLVAPGALAAVETLHDFGLLSMILGAAERPGLLARLMGREADIGAAPDAMLRLSVLAVAVEEDIARLAERLRLSNSEREQLIVVDRRLPERVPKDERAARRALYEMGPERWRRTMLAAAVVADGTHQEWRALYALASRWQAPKFPLRGSDAIELGLAPGPEVGQVLRQLESWWIEGDFSADEPALRRRLGELVNALRA